MTSAEIASASTDRGILGARGLSSIPVKRYSSGMRPVGILRRSARRAGDLIVDEVLSVGDYLFRRRLERMRQIMAGDAPIVFVSHNIRAVATFARAAAVDRGRVAQSLRPRVIKTYLTAANSACLGAPNVTPHTKARSDRPMPLGSPLIPKSMWTSRSKPLRDPP